MKRILALGLSALLCASCLAGCSKDKSQGTCSPGGADGGRDKAKEEPEEGR